ncbi:hypothetical protein A2U01_0086658, partial [Trifolium medium]|nr:hypothetical protein [Trifolium medium]
MSERSTESSWSGCGVDDDDGEESSFGDFG